MALLLSTRTARSDGSRRFAHLMNGDVVECLIHHVVSLSAKCADCHSDQVRTPIYGRLAPMSWLMESDIVRGRKAMNLALWSTYSADRRLGLAQGIYVMTSKGKMPLPQYRLIHWIHASTTQTSPR